MAGRQINCNKQTNKTHRGNFPLSRTLFFFFLSNVTSSKRVCGLMVPLRSSVYILKSEPGNERSSAHFPNFFAARGFVYQTQPCETPRGDERRRRVYVSWKSRTRGATRKLLSGSVYRNGPCERTFSQRRADSGTIT